MSSSTTAVTLHILDKEYRIACPAGEEEALQEAARYFNERVKEIRQSGKVMGHDRIAVMAALNVVHELLNYQRREQGLDKSLGSRIKTLQGRIESALSEAKQMEL